MTTAKEPKPAPRAEAIQVIRSPEPGKYLVPSASSSAEVYVIETNAETGRLTCTCPGGQTGSGWCKHIKAVQALEGHEDKERDQAVGEAVDKKMNELFGNIEKAPATPTKKSGKEEWVSAGGYKMQEVISAMHKMIRLGREEEAVFWALEAYDKSPGYTWKRVVLQASEDVGLADPATVQLVVTLALGWQFCKNFTRPYLGVDPQAITQAVISLCRAPKSSAVDDLQFLMYLRSQDKTRPKPAIPDEALDGHTDRGKAMGRAGNDFFYGQRLEKQMTTGILKDNPYFRAMREEYPKEVGWTELPEGIETE